MLYSRYILGAVFSSICLGSLTSSINYVQNVVDKQNLCENEQEHVSGQAPLKLQMSQLFFSFHRVIKVYDVCIKWFSQEIHLSSAQHLTSQPPPCPCFHCTHTPSCSTSAFLDKMYAFLTAKRFFSSIALLSVLNSAHTSASACYNISFSSLSETGYLYKFQQA